MSSISASLQHLNAMQRMQWMLSVLAIVACLYSVDSVHSHEAGLHSLDSACISCDLEDGSSHGATFADASTSTENLAFIEPAASLAVVHVAAAKNRTHIRATPTHC